MHIEFLVEEPSAEVALNNILAKILKNQATFAIHPHQGKLDLLRKLPGRLRAYRAWIPADWRIVVLMDADREDCRELKARMEQESKLAYFPTKSSPRDGVFGVVNRLAVEELEAWFFGDVEGLRKAYPRIPRSLSKNARFRDPDAIVGGTWEALEHLLQRHGYFQGGLTKIEAARNISRFMDPSRNRSRSFQVFREGVLACLA